VTLKFENPPLPEGINNTERHPLVDLGKLFAGTLALAAVLFGALFVAANVLTPLIPFRYEEKLVDGLFKPKSANPQVESYLQNLADRLGRAEGLPADVHVRLHYEDSPEVNAFATVGGHIVVLRGLIEKMPHENALALVIAHEVAHVRHRHPVAAIGRAAALGIALSVFSEAGAKAAQSAVSKGGVLTLLSFTRSQEEEADATALAAVASVYGHVAGADSFFRSMLAEARPGGDVPLFLSSHPLTPARIDALNAASARNRWSTAGATTPVPDEIRAALKVRREPPVQ
jgi:predicted Zn-dependent protease